MASTLMLFPHFLNCVSLYLRKGQINRGRLRYKQRMDNIMGVVLVDYKLVSKYKLDWFIYREVRKGKGKVTTATTCA